MSFREAKRSVPNHLVNRWQNQNLNPDLIRPSMVSALFICCHFPCQPEEVSLRSLCSQTGYRIQYVAIYGAQLLSPVHVLLGQPCALAWGHVCRIKGERVFLILIQVPKELTEKAYPYTAMRQTCPLQNKLGITVTSQHVYHSPSGCYMAT